jgi:hypothetical protein
MQLMVTKLKFQAGRCLGLAFASFLVFTLLMSGAALAQERHDAEREMSVTDEFLAQAHAVAAELGAEFGLSAADAASLVDTLLFTAGSNIEPGTNMRRMMADLSAIHGLEPRELFGFLQLYGAELMAIGQDYGLVPARDTRPAFGPRSADPAGSGPVGPRSRWQYGPRGAEEMRPARGPAHGPGPERPGMARADAMRNRFRQMHEEFHMQDAGYGGKAHDGSNMDMRAAAQRHRVDPKVPAWKTEQAYVWRHAAKDVAAKDWDGPGRHDGMYGKRGGPEAQSRYGDVDAARSGRTYGKADHAVAWSRFDKRQFAQEAAWHDIETPDRMRTERMRFGEHPDGRMRGGRPDFRDEDGLDVSVEPLVGGFEPDMMGLEHNVATMVPVVLDVVGSTIIESLAESTGVPEAEMEAMVVQALLEGLDAAMGEGLITQADAFNMLMLLTAADAVEQ